MTSQCQGRQGRGDRAFTLIELLVVVAIIAVLASMLLPALSKARAVAKRTTCLNQLKQVYLGAAIYYEDFEGELPTNFTSWDNSWSGEDCIMARYAFINGNPNGWDQFYMSRHLRDVNLLTCPAMEVKPFLSASATNREGLFHYGYRYNNAMLANYHVQHPLEADDRSWRPLFHDAVAYRSSTHWTWWGYYNNNMWSSQREWAHETGGNIVAHDGSGRWFYNYWWVWGTNMGYGNCTNFPSVGWHKALYDLRWSSYKLGMDEMVRRNGK